MPRLGGVAGFIAAAGAVAVMVIALVFVGHRHEHAGNAPPVSMPTLAQRQAATQAAAQRLLDSVTPPPGAVQTGSDPSSPARLGNPENKLSMQNSVGVHRFWRVPGTVAQAAKWMQDHPPANVGLSSTNEAGSAGVPGRNGVRRHTTIEIWGATYTFTTLPVNVTAQQLEVEVVPAKGGGVALRADGEAGFVLPRPLAQQLPTGIDRVQVKVFVTRPARASSTAGGGGSAGAQHSASRLRARSYDLLSRDRIAELVDFMNLLPPSRLSGAACVPRTNAATVHAVARVGIALKFYSGTDAKPVAQAGFDPACDVVRLAVPGRPQQDLLPTFPGSDASRYNTLMAGLATNFAVPLAGARSHETLSTASGLKGRTVPPARAP
jgi:hypothetical protein